MIGFALGLIAGIAACEVAGRHVGGYSVVLDTVEWIKRRARGIL